MSRKDFQAKLEQMHLLTTQLALDEQEAKTAVAKEQLESLREVRPLIVDEQKSKTRAAALTEDQAEMMRQFTAEAIKDNRNPMN